MPQDTSHLQNIPQLKGQEPNKPFTSDKPFIIELRQLDKTPSGTFRPAALLYVTQALRTSGLLPALPPDDLKCLMFLLTFLSPNGDCRAALHQLAEAMHVSSFKAQKRMQHLAGFRWNGQPLVVEVRSESGLVTYCLSHHVTTYQNAPEPAEEQPAPLQTASREAVIALSRQRYGRPRAEVEAEIEAMLTRGRPGMVRLPVPLSPVPPSPRTHPSQSPTAQPSTAQSPVVSSPAGVPSVANVPVVNAPVVNAPVVNASVAVAPRTLSLEEGALLRKLENAGLMTEQALALMDKYDWVRIERQLQWLPYRGAKNPAGFLLAAVADNYEAPPALRHVKSLDEETGTNQTHKTEEKAGAFKIADS